MQKSPTKALVLCALGSAFLCVCAAISIPFAVPFTLQTFGIALLLLLFGSRRTLFCVLLYLAIGLLGMPVFAGFVGGIGVFASFSGGFLVGFVFMVGAFWCLRLLKAGMGLSLFVAFLALYATAGVYILALCAALGAPQTFGAIFTAFVLPYLPFDLLKAALAYFLAKRLARHAFFRAL